jgi:type IV secretory pathway component VirB8
MVYFKKDGGSYFEEILIWEMERSEKMRKYKQAVKLIAIIYAICTATAASFFLIVTANLSLL